MNRIPYFDNARAILIYLVIVGHILSKYIDDSHLLGSIYMFIYTFHMPAFILISGFFAKKIYESGYLTKVIKKLLFPYILLQIFYSVYYYYIFDDSIELSLFIPRWALWFLLSLILWNILLYFFGKIKYGLPLALVISILIGYDDSINEVLSLSRTFFFFPFFLVGYYLKTEHLLKLKSRTHVLNGVLLAMIGFITIYYFVPIEQHVWLLGKRPYDEISTVPMQWAWLGRFVAYIVMFTATYMFLTLVSNKRRFYTSIGSVTISIYLLHMVVIRIFYDSPIKEYILESKQYWLIFVFAASILFILSRKPVYTVVNQICTLPTKKNILGHK
ncbi:acyltransferase family protein [Lysinibacillus endophyticus]|uniref:Acyltransferase n=1 Tax=Ureibacillus endophyticus TaxID=1978490 RepID=A0A494ZB61_9BACL|nr:acyltransferase family protein [Lysinibacillus endophyticus]MCP1145570.1 acyltransferase family protein [Lysinibacillus endophyticus]RKQ20040.1 acyltransferase [Lysinibacillus endophyticus]